MSHYGEAEIDVRGEPLSLELPLRPVANTRIRLTAAGRRVPFRICTWDVTFDGGGDRARILAREYGDGVLTLAIRSTAEGVLTFPRVPGYLPIPSRKIRVTAGKITEIEIPVTPEN